MLNAVFYFFPHNRMSINNMGDQADVMKKNIKAPGADAMNPMAAEMDESTDAFADQLMKAMETK